MDKILAPLFNQVNSAPCCVEISAADNRWMEKTKKSKIEPVHIDESAKLKAIFKERAKLSQAEFGAEFEIGSQGMVWQYLNAVSPLNLTAALKFSRGLNCPVCEFSPRLAAELSLSSSEQQQPQSTLTPPQPTGAPALTYAQIKAAVNGFLNAFGLDYTDLEPNEKTAEVKITEKLLLLSNTKEPVVQAEFVSPRTARPGEIESGVAGESTKESPRKRAEGER